MDRVSDRYSLVGDADSGVGVECVDHWRGGMPIIYYYPGSYFPYPPDQVVRVTTVNDLFVEIGKHEMIYHKDNHNGS